MKHLGLLAAAAAIAFAAPATAQIAYSGGAATFTGLGSDQNAYPGTPFDTVDFAPVAGLYFGNGDYVLNDVTFSAGVNRNDSPFDFSGVFSLTGDFGGQLFTYDVNYTGTIGSNEDTITIGGNTINVLGSSVYLRPITLTGTVADPIAFGQLVAGVGVPEPATWGLMIVGFGAVGGALRRRSTKVAYAA